MQVRMPVSTASGQFALEIRDQMQHAFFDQLKNEIEVDGEVVEPVRALPWYPDNLAWHLNYSHMQIRKMHILERIHEFLKLENEVGSITCQEAVSMIPPLFLNDSLITGFLMVIANDSDSKRCHLLIHQTKRMCSPNIVVINHDSQLFPGLKDKSGHLETTPTENSVVDI